ncbi:MAG: FkbM family methyltransferase [Tabrizicola sp.]
MHDLSGKQFAQLVFSNLLGRLGLDNRVPVKLSRENGIYIAELPDRLVAIPSAKRWRNYKRGWDRRLLKLSSQFGLGDAVSIRTGDVVIDIGANVGEFCVAASNLGATVHAIEGDPLVFGCLEFNTKSLTTIIRHQNVVWREDTTLTFYSEPTEANSSVFLPMGDAPVRELKVEAVRLDTLAEQAGIDQVAFLKCDAEGAEPEVIEGGRELLARTRAVAFDTGPERLGAETSEECGRLLSELGFAVRHEMRARRKITFGLRS